MAKMEFKRLPTGFSAQFPVETGLVYLTIKQVHESRDNALNGILIVKIYHNNEWYKLFTGKFNLMAPNTRSRLAKYISEVQPETFEANWLEIIEAFSQHAIEAYYETPEPIRIQKVDDLSPKFILYPIIPKHHPALIFAPGGSGKSFLAMYLSLFVKNNIPLVEDGEVEGGEVMYVDWEVNAEEAARRYTMLANGFHVEDIEFPLYKKATLPLVDELEDLLENVVKYEVKLLIIDSAAPAVGGDINDASKVINFFQAIRQLTDAGASVLIITHVSKADKESENASPVGSVFFENLSRITWELKYTSPDKGIIDFALIPRKTNFGRFDPLGFRAIFQYGIVTFQRIDPNNVASNKEVVLKDLIYSYLQANPEGLSVRELSELTGYSKQYISKKLHELKKRGEVYNTKEGKWRLLAEESDEDVEIIDLESL